MGKIGNGVADGARTHDTWNHNPVLYQLNYSHHWHRNEILMLNRQQNQLNWLLNLI